MSIEKLEWDSKFFGKKIGKLLLTHEVKSMEEFYPNEFDLIYVFSKTRQNILEENGFELVDTKVNYVKSSDHFYNEDVATVKSYSGEMSEKLISLALQSGWKSRFKRDSSLNLKFDELYILWLEKSLNRTIADEFFVAYDGDEICGFVSVSAINDLGKIGLISVDGNIRGKGIGSNLIKKAENWYRNNNLRSGSVVTQLENIEACRFYEKNGYTIGDKDFIYHVK
jgi:dTDP-4-amino-4,6-dideoxy-D-galactose acyltransferase